MTTRLWFPPAPAEAPLSVLDLDPAQWAMEAKIDGCRVIFRDNKIFNRHGSPMSAPKIGMAAGFLKLPPGTVVEGEWVLKDDRLWVFDLPSHGGTYEERRAALRGLIEEVAAPFARVEMIPVAHRMSFRFFYEWRKKRGDEGVVVKRRTSRYPQCSRPGTIIQDWKKRRFSWDK